MVERALENKTHWKPVNSRQDQELRFDSDITFCLKHWASVYDTLRVGRVHLTQPQYYHRPSKTLNHNSERSTR